MPIKYKFQEGEKVLCFHGPLLYEAKCMKTETKDKLPKYFIHYNGWNKSWDEWVPESRVVKLNEAGYQKQKELLAAHKKTVKEGKAKNKAEREKEKEKATKVKEKTDAKNEKPEKSERGGKKSVTSTPTMEERNPRDSVRRGGVMTAAAAAAAAASASSGTPLSTTPASKRDNATPGVDQSKTEDQPKKKRAKLDPSVESEESYLTKIEVKVKIPDDLKALLVDDWDLITRQKQLVSLPCRNSVQVILGDYAKFKLTKCSNVNEDMLNEVTSGIKEYFNAMLGSQLLYRFERPQYSQILADHPDTPMCEIYGAVHLLRLFVRIGSFLAYTELDEKSIQILLNQIQDFLKYMVKNISTLFSTCDYMISTPDYHRKTL